MKRTLVPFIALFLAACTNKEQERLLLELRDLDRSNAAIDSLMYSLDDMRARVDSTQPVNDKLLENVEKFTKELRHWSKLATEYKQSNARLKLKIEQLRREAQELDALASSLSTLYNDLEQTRAQINSLHQDAATALRSRP